MRRGVRYTATVLALGLLAGAGSSMVRPEWREGVWVGAGVAVATQVLLFWTLFVWLLPGRQMLAHGLGMMSRLVVFAVVALLALRLPVGTAASTLFTLVAVFFASTVLEPVFLRPEPLKRS